MPWKVGLIDKFAATNLITSNLTAADVEELIGNSGLQIVQNIRNGHQLLFRARRAATATSAVQAHDAGAATRGRRQEVPQGR